MFKLSLGDLWRGLVMAVFGAGSVAVLGVVGAVVMEPGFDVFTTDFASLLKSLTNAMIVASYSSGSSYLLKNLLTDDRQNFLGIPTKS
jgi:hypothetical protein